MNLAAKKIISISKLREATIGDLREKATNFEDDCRKKSEGWPVTIVTLWDWK